MTRQGSPIAEVAGYCDDVSYRPGDTVVLRASGTGRARVGLARLRGLVDDDRAGWAVQALTADGSGEVELAPQPVVRGSYAVVDSPWNDDQPGALAVELWFRASRPGGAGTVASWVWQDRTHRLAHVGDRLVLEVDGHPAAAVPLGEALAWHRVRVEVDAARGRVTVRRDDRLEEGALPSPTRSAHARFVVAGDVDAVEEDGGRLDGAVAEVTCTVTVGDSARLLAAWDFGIGDRDDVLRDTSGNARHGRLLQLPVRGVPGPHWRRDEVDPRLAPEQFDATRFHTDDLADSRWPVTAELVVPEGTPSGVYAVTIEGEGGRDHVPFVVRSVEGSRGRAAFLLSTFTYLAYANANLGDRIDYVEAGISGRTYQPAERDLQIQRTTQVAGSLYDVHSDGSGRYFSTLLRPIFNFRADFASAVQQAPRHLGADLLIWEWLCRQPYDVDVITDHDLHREGREALAGYDVVVTSSHPEYYSLAMLEALEEHRDAGGGLMYLGGNGFYWVTSGCDPDALVVECRRGNAGTRTWDSPAGETHHASTGEPGGLWRHRGRSPNALVGIGMASQGWDERASAFRTSPELLADGHELAWMFAGMRDPARFGDAGLVMDGASGDELDRYDVDLGSPRDAVVVATSEAHSGHYMLVHEDVLMSEARLGADVNDKVRSDVVWHDVPGGGATFAVGSITWAGAMAHDDFDNDTATFTTNVLTHLMDRSRP